MLSLGGTGGGTLGEISAAAGAMASSLWAAEVSAVLDSAHSWVCLSASTMRAIVLATCSRVVAVDPSCQAAPSACGDVPIPFSYSICAPTGLGHEEASIAMDPRWRLSIWQQCRWPAYEQHQPWD